jgi:hypothetical protein
MLADKLEEEKRSKDPLEKLAALQRFRDAWSELNEHFDYADDVLEDYYPKNLSSFTDTLAQVKKWHDMTRISVKGALVNKIIENDIDLNFSDTSYVVEILRSGLGHGGYENMTFVEIVEIAKDMGLVK